MSSVIHLTSIKENGRRKNFVWLQFKGENAVEKERRQKNQVSSDSKQPCMPRQGILETYLANFLVLRITGYI